MQWTISWTEDHVADVEPSDRTLPQNLAKVISYEN